MANRQEQANARLQRQSAPVAMQHVSTRTTGHVDVRSPDLDPGGAIPERHTAYGEGRSPALDWNPVGGARSYAVLVEDPDAPTEQPFVHWLAWNIPPDMHGLPGDIRDDAASDKPTGLRQGRNDHGGTGWFGPRPPQGDPPHRYHFQVLALDAMLDLEDGASRDDLLATVDGHVLAKGELVATSEAPARH